MGYLRRNEYFVLYCKNGKKQIIQGLTISYLYISYIFIEIHSLLSFYIMAHKSEIKQYFYNNIPNPKATTPVDMED